MPKSKSIMMPVKEPRIRTSRNGERLAQITTWIPVESWRKAAAQLGKRKSAEGKTCFSVTSVCADVLVRNL